MHVCHAQLVVFGQEGEGAEYLFCILVWGSHGVCTLLSRFLHFSSSLVWVKARDWRWASWLESHCTGALHNRRCHPSFFVTPKIAVSHPEGVQCCCCVHTNKGRLWIGTFPGKPLFDLLPGQHIKCRFGYINVLQLIIKTPLSLGSHSCLICSKNRACAYCYFFLYF